MIDRKEGGEYMFASPSMERLMAPNLVDKPLIGSVNFTFTTLDTKGNTHAKHSMCISAFDPYSARHSFHADCVPSRILRLHLEFRRV
jgi:hypothetical protein